MSKLSQARRHTAPRIRIVALVLSACTVQWSAIAAPPKPTAEASLEDPRIRRIEYSADAVVSVHTKRGQVTHIVLPPDEKLIGEHAAGQGSNCESPTDTWCVAVGETQRDLFVKPREGATVNNLSLVTNKRRYAFELLPLEKGTAAMRVVITVPPPPPAPTLAPAPAVVNRQPTVALPVVPPPLTEQELVANRMRAVPLVRNADYSVAIGPGGDELAPTMVFDDGRFTYFRFPGNKPLPALFMTTSDNSEQTVNTRMSEDGLLIADRVGRRFVLRLGEAASAVINEAFDPEGAATKDGTAVPGVARVVLKTTEPGGAQR